MFQQMLLADGLSTLNLRSTFRKSVRRRQRPRRDESLIKPRSRGLAAGRAVHAQQLAANQFPPDQVTATVALSNIIWNGGASCPVLPASRQPEFSFPVHGRHNEDHHADELWPATIYPFIRGENTGQDPASTSGNLYYDPQDVTGLWSFENTLAIKLRRHVYWSAIKSVHHISVAAGLLGWRQLLHRHRRQQSDNKHQRIQLRFQCENKHRRHHAIRHHAGKYNDVGDKGLQLSGR